MAIRAYYQVFKKVKKLISSQIDNVKYQLAGSVAKGTFIDGHREIDVFLLMDSQNIAKFWAVLPNIFKTYKKHHTSIPYVTVNYAEYTIDIVPVGPSGQYSDVKSKKVKNLETLDHVPYVKSRLTPKNLKRILQIKTKFKNGGIYGAESAIGGFSGYFCQLLGLAGPTKSLTILNQIINGLPFLDPVNLRRNIGAAVLPEVAITGYRLILNQKIQIPKSVHWYIIEVKKWDPGMHKFRKKIIAIRKKFKIFSYTNGINYIWIAIIEKFKKAFYRGPKIKTKNIEKYINRFLDTHFIYGQHHWHQKTVDLEKILISLGAKKTFAPVITSKFRQFAIE